MIVYKAVKNNMGIHINKNLIQKYKNLGYQIYEIDTKNNTENEYKLEEMNGCAPVR